MLLMIEVLKPFTSQFVVVYFDDILVFSKTEDEHLTHLQVVLQALRDNKLFLNMKKCEYFSSQFLFLGFLISAKGI